MYAKVPGGEPIFQLIVVAMLAGDTPKLHIVCPCEESILVPLTYIIDWDAPESNVHIALLAPDDVIVVLAGPLTPPVINACSLVLYVTACCSVTVNVPAAVEIKFAQTHPAVPANVAEPFRVRLLFIVFNTFWVTVLPADTLRLFNVILFIIQLELVVIVKAPGFTIPAVN